jgi:putative flavoprotein involved in K+ transport
MQHNVDVLVIGADQAGLAMGYYLKQNNILFVIVGKEDRIGVFDK